MRPTPSCPRPPRPGFTIVELLVVIGVLTLLVGLLLPALSGAQARGRKARETNAIRQIGIAWNLYAQSNKDAALPGYLDGTRSGPEGETVQQSWRVRYNFANGEQVADADVEPWPWRLLQYLDYSQETLMGHLDLDETSPLSMSDYTLMDPVPHRADGRLPRPTHIAREPGFGYNAFYVGGWWDRWAPLTDSNGEVVGHVAAPRFRSVFPIDRQGVPETRTTSVVVRSVGTIQDGSSLVLFCSSTLRARGEYHQVEDARFGSHVVAPPFVAEQAIWRRKSSTGSDEVIEVVDGLDSGDAPVPIGRYTGQAAVLFADLHAEPFTPGELDDQRFWINGATRRLYRHSSD